jgi:2-oxoglutarate ferredoxin oxidoreductase subunit beta
VEIYQNCPVFNDRAFAPLKDPKTRDERLIRLGHGQQVRFGTDGHKGLRLGRYGAPEIVEMSPAAQADTGCVLDTRAQEILIHDAHLPDPSYAFALSQLDGPGLEHTAIGVFRSVERASYDALMTGQLEAARAEQGDGDLAELLAGPESWRVG